jgi:environmental stress-induced protein Ves
VNPVFGNLTIVNAGDVAPQPWKNGGGATRELLRLALPGGGADDWLLRISVADITSEGLFSSFPGITRWFAVLEGAGVHLLWDSNPACSSTPQSDALEMAGDNPPYCRPIAGPTRDLNVMVHSRAGSAHLARAQADVPWRWRASERGIFTLRPVVLNGRGWRHTLPPFTLAWDSSGDTSAWSLSEVPAPARSAAHTPPTGAPAAWWIGLRRATPSTNAES